MTNMDIASEIIGLLDRFCGGFAAGDTEAIAATCDMSPDLTVVTSEQLVLRGGDEVAAFLERYQRGATRYAWTWDRHDVASHGDTAWLLATGTETATTGPTVSSHPYRMTLVAISRGDHWALIHAHGSSPHQDQPAESPTTEATS